MKSFVFNSTFLILSMSMIHENSNAEEVVWTQFHNIGFVQNQSDYHQTYVEKSDYSSWFLPSDGCKAVHMKLVKDLATPTAYDDVFAQILLASSTEKKVRFGGVCNDEVLSVLYITVEHY